MSKDGKPSLLRLNQHMNHGELVYSGSTFSNRRIINTPKMRSELNPVTQTKCRTVIEFHNTKEIKNRSMFY